MDLMSQAVDQMRLRRVQYREQLTRAPWSSDHAEGAAGLHLVLSGRAVLQHDANRHELAAGDLVIVPRSLPHVLRSVPAADRDEHARILGGTLEFEAPDHPLLNVLPPVIHGTVAQLRSTTRCTLYIERIVDEARSGRDGAEALVTRLTEVLLIEAMRFFTPPPGVECPVRGWFSGLRDPSIRRALTAIHEDPGGAWTVDSLARVAGQSRSAFAAHFTNINAREPRGLPHPLAHVPEPSTPAAVRALPRGDRPSHRLWFCGGVLDGVHARARLDPRQLSKTGAKK